MKRSSEVPLFWKLAVLLLMFAGGFLVHVGISSKTIEAEIRAMSTHDLAVDLMYYHGMLDYASGAGCQLSIEQFRRYHVLNHELKLRPAP